MINQFRDNYWFLSNFYPCKIEYGGIRYMNAEAAYQAQKYPPENRYLFTHLDAKEAKKLGRSGKLPDDWEAKKDQIMYEIVLTKFTQNSDLRDKLLATVDEELVEGNFWHDNYWGVCSCPKCEDKPKHNKLGKILMAVRQELKKSCNKGLQKKTPRVAGEVRLTLNKADFMTIVQALAAYAGLVKGSKTLENEFEHACELAYMIQGVANLSDAASEVLNNDAVMKDEKERSELFANNLRTYLGKNGPENPDNTDNYVVEISFGEVWKLTV